MIGQTVGHYKIVSKLGEGGMGAVYLAEDTKLDRQVALKFLPPRVAGDPEVLERFKREAKAAAALDHPNIVTVHEIGEHDGRPYIAMSYVAGELLSATIARGDMTLDKALQITMQVCDGLAKAHKAGIVHRDIKPDNIAIDADGHVKILDFGLAKLGGVTRLTQEQSTLGTLAYMSPEQTRGEDVDGRSDLFSLGAILYEMITGRRAFSADHAAAIQYAIASEQPQPLARFNNQATPELERIVAKLLAKDANVRYQTAADVMADIRALRSDSGSAPSLPAAPPSRSRRGLMWVGAAVVVVAAVALAVLKPFAPHGPAPAEARPMIVVLPFENLGASDDEYFADGITEEITSRLATITGIGVISRTSAMRYKGADKSVAQIADELGVNYVLEGSIRWDKSNTPSLVRITPQLIRVADDTHLWADNYERSLNRIFEVQADIAAHIAEAMEVTLLDKERSTIESVPTENTEAYTYFLRGRELTQGGATFMSGQVEPSMEAFKRAVEIDPKFALAWAWLSITNASYYHNGLDRTPARLEMAKEQADRAIELAPDLADSRLAKAYYYYWGLKDYDTAIDWSKKAEEARSGDAKIIELYGWILRRLGRFDDARKRLEESLALSPQERGVMLGIAECFMISGRLEDATTYVRRATALEPDDPVAYMFSEVIGFEKGDLDEARRALESYPGNDRVIVPYLWYEYYYRAREFDKAVAAVESASTIEYSDEGVFYPNSLVIGLAHLAEGDSTAGRRDLKVAYDTLVALTEKRPDDHRLYSSIGLALAGLGDGEAAVANGRKSVDMYPVSKDRYGGPWRVTEMARIYSLAGYVDEGIAEVDKLLSLDSHVNANWVKLHPDFDNLRSDPRFEEVLRKHGLTT